MARCPVCGEDMTRDDIESCSVRLEDFIPYGDEDWYEHSDPPPNCHDCGVRPGGIHHPGCDVERCPRCITIDGKHAQRISCWCGGEDEA